MKTKRKRIGRKKFKVVELKRSTRDWSKLVEDARDKETTWKFFREHGQGMEYAPDADISY